MLPQGCSTFRGCGCTLDLYRCTLDLKTWFELAYTAKVRVDLEYKGRVDWDKVSYWVGVAQ